MSILPPASPRRLALVLAIGAVTACADQPTAPAGPRLPGRASATLSSAPGKPRLVPNHVRYRDRGMKPSTGRSGSAALTAQALVGRDGVTELQVTSSGREGWWWQPRGSIDQLQVRAATADGHPLGTLTERLAAQGSEATLAYPGFARGTRLQVQGIVRGIDGSRADVVSVTETVKRRPNLKVVGVQAPAQAFLGMWTVVSATVRETNGDVGSTGACVLYVNGERADWAYHVWVDAGDAVTCAFSHRFTARGPQALEVRLESVLPRDDDPSDNAGAAAIEVVTTDQLSWTAWVDQVSGSDAWSWRQQTRNEGGSGEEYLGRYEYAWSEQRVSLEGSTPVEVERRRLPLHVEAESGGTPLFTSEFLFFDEAESPPWYCDSRWDGTLGLSAYVCSDPWYGTWVSVQRYAGSSVYHSEQYSRTWDGLTGAEHVYHDTYDSEYSTGTPLALGGDFAFRLRLGTGGETFHAAGAFPLRAGSNESFLPYQCSTWTWWDGSTTESCYESRWSFTSLSGYAWGGP